MGLKIEVKGKKEAVRRIVTKERACRNAFIADVRAATNLMRDDARLTTLFRDRSRRLRKAIRSKLEEKRGGKIRFKWGPDPKRAPYGHLVEGGHELVTSKARGHRVIGHVDERPFMRQAFDRKKDEAVKIIREGQRKALRS